MERRKQGHSHTIAILRTEVEARPTAWTPGTNGLVRGEAVLVTAITPEELAPYKGRLKGKWVLTQAVPDVTAYWTAPSKRYTLDELAALELNPAPGLEFGVTPPGQRAGAPVAAVFAYLTANRDEKIPRKPLPVQGQRSR